MKRRRSHTPIIVIMLIVITFITGFYSGRTFGIDDNLIIANASTQNEKETNDAATKFEIAKLDSLENNMQHIQPDAEQSAAPDILLVNKENPLPRDYQHEEFVNLYEQSGRHFQLAKSDIRVCATVFDAMERMFSAALADEVDGFIITSGYRTFEEQNELYQTRTDGTAARPGESEHETGLAFDVVVMGSRDFALTPQYQWLAENCGDYGFILRYPYNKESITGTPFEPWHYRYVGLPHSLTIMDEGLTLEEYLAR